MSEQEEEKRIERIKNLRGSYVPFNDGCGIVGYLYECPNCGNINHSFTNSCSDGCEECNFSEPFVNPDEWYDYQMSLPVKDRRWNKPLK